MKDNETTEEKKPGRLRRLINNLRKAPVVAGAVMIIIAAELIMIFVAPMVIPDEVYMRLYLTDFAEENTIEYLHDTDKYNIRDTLVGWQNRPGCVYDKWHTDRNGARATHEYTMTPEKANRVMFLGSSIINGGPFVYIDETISAIVEDSMTESINFGVMRYSMDQVYLRYTNDLHEYNPDIIIVEINAAPCAGLRNQYIPFRDRFAADMPYLKPRYMLNGGELEFVALPPRGLLDSIFCNSGLVNWLEERDCFYSEFESFKRFGLMPISSTAWKVFNRAGNLRRILAGDPEGERILELLMHRLVEEASRHGASVIFLSLPDLTLTAPERWRKMLPDRYLIRLDQLRSNGFDIIDAREIFRKSGHHPRRLFVHDNRHLTPLGNRLVAEELKSHLDKLLREDIIYTGSGADSSLTRKIPR